MTNILTRAGKGYPLTHDEVDANFNNLNQNKVEVSDFNTALAKKANLTGANFSGPISAPALDSTPIGQTTAAAVKGTTGVFTSGIDSTAIGQMSPAAVASTTFTATTADIGGGTSTGAVFKAHAAANSNVEILTPNSGSGVRIFARDDEGILNRLELQGGSVVFPLTTGADGLMFDATSGNFTVGESGASWNKITKNVTLDAGSVILEVAKSGSSTSAAFYGVTNGGWNAAHTAMVVGADLVTGRSFNTGGTINASGSDYAENMTKADGCGTVAKAQIVGVDADGKLTDKWSEIASGCLIKSTDPCMVGGDKWGTEEALGMARPVEPQFIQPVYTGTASPGPAPVKPEPPAPVADDSSDEEKAAYEKTLNDYNAALDAYYVAFNAWDSARATYDLDQSAYAARVATAQQVFDTGAYPTYQTNLATFEAKLEAARQRIDRMGYCGQVPVNVVGATPGQYIVPAEGTDDTIIGVLINDADITFEQYRRAVGIVQNILPDGRANIRVKVC